jgi:hypothetical protein
MIQIKSPLYFLLLLGILTGCQSHSVKELPLTPQPLAVFTHEIVWLTTSTSNTSQKQQVNSFNLKLKDRLKMYGANNVQTINKASPSNKGLIIISKINTDNEEDAYQLSILRENRELIRGSYPNTPEGEEVAINKFLMSIHQKNSQC